MFLAPQLKGYHLEFDTGTKVFKNNIATSFFYRIINSAITDKPRDALVQMQWRG